MVRCTAALICALFCAAEGLKVREPEPTSQLHEQSGDGISIYGHINASKTDRYLIDASAKAQDLIWEKAVINQNERLATDVGDYIKSKEREAQDEIAKLNKKAQDPAKKYTAESAVVDEGQYCGCNSSACNVDAGRLERELTHELILIMGCSLDINAIEYFCNAVGSTVEKFKTVNPFSYLSHCNVGRFTLAYMFHPGSSPTPYFTEFAGTATTKNVVTNSLHDVRMQFGRDPSLIVVDSSLWDVSNWWEKKGRPAAPYPVPTADIHSWCTQYVPELLAHVQTVYPHSGIAFRTAPTVFAANGYGQQPEIIDAMVQCIATKKDPMNRLYGKYGYIDYHNFVDEVLQHAAGPAMKTYYKDSLHPGPTLSLMYMNKVLNLARGLQR